MTKTTKMLCKAAVIAFALGGASLPVLAADVTVAVTPNANIAFGYSDGYWDRDHAWHQWRNRDEASAWRKEHDQYYYDRKHDAERDMGWRSDRWWERH